MIISKKDRSFYIKEDRKRYEITWKKELVDRIKCGQTHRCLRFLKYLRYYEYSYNNRNRNLFYKLYWIYQKRKYNKIQFKYDTYVTANSIGPGLYIPHLGGIIVNCISMGKNCSFTKGVVIGNRKGQENRAIIGDNCWFLLGCKVVGKISVGNGVIVTQNSVLVKDVEDNCIVSGIPAKVIKKYNNIEDINI